MDKERDLERNEDDGYDDACWMQRVTHDLCTCASVTMQLVY